MGKFGSRNNAESGVVATGLKLNGDHLTTGNHNLTTEPAAECKDSADAETVSIGMKPSAVNGQAPRVEGHVNPAFEQGEDGELTIKYMCVLLLLFTLDIKALSLI